MNNNNSSGLITIHNSKRGLPSREKGKGLQLSKDFGDVVASPGK